VIFIVECVQDHSSDPGVLLLHRTMVGPFATFDAAHAWMAMCGAPTMLIHMLEGPENALLRGNAQVEDGKTPFGFKAWSEGEKSETSRRHHAVRKGDGKETRR